MLRVRLLLGVGALVCSAQLYAQVGGTGTAGTVPVWKNSTTIGNSNIKQNVNGSVSVTANVTAVTGTTKNNGATGASGVSGLATSTSGITNGVSGTNASATNGANGVLGVATATTGIVFGVQGFASSAQGVGVQGVNNVNSAPSGFIATGVQGITTAASGLAIGVSGTSVSTNGIGVQGGAPWEGLVGVNQICTSSGCVGQPGNAGVFTTGPGGNVLLGNVTDNNFHWIPVVRIDSAGKGFFDGGTQMGGADFAESVHYAGKGTREAGDLMAIDDRGKRQIVLAREPYSTLVAGIYSTKPGVLATPHKMADTASGEIPLAIVGIVPCKVTAENGPIRAGDLLVSSSTAGYAMKGTDHTRMLGAVVGKALEALPDGKGVIEVLVTLQ